MYLIRAEQRYGNGDHLFTIDEQTNAINALYDVARGEHQQLGVGRRAQTRLRDQLLTTVPLPLRRPSAPNTRVAPGWWGTAHTT